MVELERDSDNESQFEIDPMLTKLIICDNELSSSTAGINGPEDSDCFTMTDTDSAVAKDMDEEERMDDDDEMEISSLLTIPEDEPLSPEILEMEDHLFYCGRRSKAKSLAGNLNLRSSKSLIKKLNNSTSSLNYALRKLKRDRRSDSSFSSYMESMPDFAHMVGSRSSTNLENQLYRALSETFSHDGSEVDERTCCLACGSKCSPCSNMNKNLKEHLVNCHIDCFPRDLTELKEYKFVPLSKVVPNFENKNSNNKIVAAVLPQAQRKSAKF